jgi:hypothetical protein
LPVTTLARGGRGRSQVLLARREEYSASMAARQFGSARAAR